MASTEAREAVGEYSAGWHDPENATIRFDSGLSEQVVRDISALKNEPDWMTELRVKAFHNFESKPGMMSRKIFEIPSINWVFQMRNRSGYRELPHSMNPRLFITQ